MRSLLALFSVCLLAGCPSATPTADVPVTGSGSGGGGAFQECVTDSECVLAGASCCACPSYAIPASSPGVNACDGVGCPTPTCADNVQASCVQGSCAMTCKPLACDLSCASGFAVDATGCLTCACAAADGCGSDGDCHEVGADCCGCARGGSDTAVVDVAAHDASLSCPPAPQCPGVDVCDAGAVVECRASRCMLLSPADQTLPSTACGRPDLPTCPGATSTQPAEVCVINALATANAQGVGVCLSP